MSETNRPYEVDDRVTAQCLTAATRPLAGAPAARPLRIYSLDPSVSYGLGGIATVAVPYEELKPGPIGRLFEVVCGTPPEGLVAAPLDLDDRALLLSSGLTPTPANARFHLQMTYAVCSLTYAAFRRALGRDIAWACAPAEGETQARLRVLPFAMKERNAFYDRDGGGLFFGWFHAEREPAGHTVPKGVVFTALSHDVIAHETTHALLDGLRSQFSVPYNNDVLGFHEGFADVVALLQHFSFPDVVAAALRDARGSLGDAALLTGLAREFGYATSKPGSARPLRSAIDVDHIDTFDADAIAPAGEKGRPVAYAPDMEPHQMGSVLVSAIFEAFATVFRRKSARYFALAGVNPQDVGTVPLSDALVDMLAREASDIAGHFLDICIRAIDYCPPVDMELGEYLRALITADADVVPEDRWSYRETFLRAFQRRGIFPDKVPFMAEDAVRWQSPARPLEIPGLAFSHLRFNGDPGHAASPKELRRQADVLGAFVTDPTVAKQLHLIAPGAKLPTHVTHADPPRIQSIRTARRVASNGSVLFDLIAEVTQGVTVTLAGQPADFAGGCTLIVDPFGVVRYAIYKRLESLERQRRAHGAVTGPLSLYWTKGAHGRLVPRKRLFRLLHGGSEAD